jgi:hypothetical protein
VIAANLKRLSDLPPADRKAALARLRAVHAQARAEGWLEWEINEPVASVARKMGIRLTPAEMRSILARAKPS